MKFLPSSLATLPVLLLSSFLTLGPTPIQAANGPSHFVISTPSTNSPWQADGVNPLAWTYSKTDILQFDVELLRLSGTGLLLVAKNVPLKDGKAVIDVEGIPEGDDYFAVFMDSYDGTVFTRSSKFSILANNTASTTVEASFTMTITGAPNPTRAFETTLQALETTTTVAGAEYVVSSAPSSVSFAAPLLVVCAGLAVGSVVGLGF